MLSGGNQTDGNTLERFLTPYQNSTLPLNDTIIHIKMVNNNLLHDNRIMKYSLSKQLMKEWSIYV